MALLLYIGGVAIYAYSQFSSTKTKLLTYCLSDATGNPLDYTVMLVALALPAMAVVRFFIGTPRPKDWVVAMVLPLASWAIAQFPPTSMRRLEWRSRTARCDPAANCSVSTGQVSTH